MKIYSEDKKIILRDMIESDIADYIRWHTVETEWMAWDAPWEETETDYEKVKRQWTEYYNHNTEKPTDNLFLRTRCEIVLCNQDETHIGWVGSYCINDNYRYTKNNGYIAVGIDIPEGKYRGCGCGYSALKTYIYYLMQNEIDVVYTQTWSGNHAMINLAKKLGFIECQRLVGKRTVGGCKYDALTFILT